MSDHFCSSCGAGHTAVARFCSSCGTQLIAAPASQQQMAAAAAPPAPVNFDASRPPRPGTPVPADCVWAEHPHPGAYTGGRLRGNVLQKLSALSPLTGRTYREIVGYVGEAAGSEKLVGGASDWTWEGTDFWSSSKVYGTLRFDRYGVCHGMVERVAGGRGGGGLLVAIDF